MSRRLKVAVRLHPGADGTAADAPEQARHAEQLGLDGIFVGDHLKPAGPYPESMVVLAAAAASTERIHVGVGVMVLALRDPAWAAKQLATLQHVSGGRVVLGVGTGGRSTAPRHGMPSASPTPSVAAAPTRCSRSCPV
jgi:alkanesulfonate monooxygenase SsuD/methylene tetrahydromethanopterin reductase-like flavin-dependent oxidoreductase (luciferase family)